MPVFWTLLPPDTETVANTFECSEVLLDLDTGDMDPRGILIFGDEATSQRIRQRLRFFLGEWFLDTRLGVPWFQLILGGRHPDYAKYVLDRVVDETPGVEKLLASHVDWDRAERLISYSFSAKLLTGSILIAPSTPFIFAQKDAA